MNADQIKALQMDSAQKKRPQRSLWAIFLVVLLATCAALFFAWPRESDQRRMVKGAGVTNLLASTAPTSVATAPAADFTKPGVSEDVVLTVSGYIINRERIEISPRFMGVVNWIGVKKGDTVTNGQIVVLLDDTEFKGRLQEAEGQLANARSALAKAELDLERIAKLARTDIESKQALDDARIRVESTQAQITAAEGARDVAQAYVGWCTIRSPINGVVLEKLVDPNELVTPQSFGGTRGPSTALLAVADPKDLQVEIDMNEADLAKVSLGQKCRVSPEAYSDKSYDGVVAEIAPEANRAKGTLQIKVQVRNPDRFLTPELSARVEFLKS
jgi:HlyD family secretion protein